MLQWIREYFSTCEFRASPITSKPAVTYQAVSTSSFTTYLDELRPTDSHFVCESNL